LVWPFLGLPVPLQPWLMKSLDGVLDFTEEAAMVEGLGFPRLPKTEVPPCGVPNPCSRERMFNDPYLLVVY